MVSNKAVFGLVIIILTSYSKLFCNGSVYKVGDSGGWTTMGNVDYKLWSATKTFRLGDIIHFVYNPEFHNVMRVTHAMYKTCNATVPMKSYVTGNDSITIISHGHHFFICGVPGHCRSGQKVDINVLAINNENSTATSPSSNNVFVSPQVPSIASPSPANDNSAASIEDRRLGINFVAFVVAFGFWLMCDFV